MNTLQDLLEDWRDLVKDFQEEIRTHVPDTYSNGYDPVKHVLEEKIDLLEECIFQVENVQLLFKGLVSGRMIASSHSAVIEQ